MEKDAIKITGNRPDEVVAVVSIAISLKRIADAITGDPENLGMKDILAYIMGSVDRR